MKALFQILLLKLLKIKLKHPQIKTSINFRFKLVRKIIF
jgi:hypothetical protein